VRKRRRLRFTKSPVPAIAPVTAVEYKSSYLGEESLLFTAIAIAVLRNKKEFNGERSDSQLVVSFGGERASLSSGRASS